MANTYTNHPADGRRRGVNVPTIVWVNGPFGVGKTTVAKLLVERLGTALFIDPEVLGHALWAQLPRELRAEEFELEPVWRVLTRRMTAEIAGRYGRSLVVAMTVARRSVFEEIIGGLRSDGHCVEHVALMGSAPTIRGRLRTRMRQRGERSDSWGELSWEGLQVDRCLAELDHPDFAIHVDTDGREPAEVADVVLATLGLASAGADARTREAETARSRAGRDAEW